jgi:molybdate transport system substrate-binding protein
VPAADVRAALMMIIRGECDAGLVYATDLRAAKGVRQLGTTSEHDPIVYPVAAVKGRMTPAVKTFLDYMASGPAQATARTRGFQ